MLSKKDNVHLFNTCLVTVNFVSPIWHVPNRVVWHTVINVMLVSVKDDIACTYFHEVDHPYPQKAIDVIDDLVVENRELHDVLIEERNT